MSRMISIDERDLRELVKASEERIRISGTHAAHRALATAQLLLDTMIPDADDLLGWTKATRSIARLAAADRALSPEQLEIVDYLVGGIAEQSDQFGINPHHAPAGLGGLAALLVAANFAARHQHPADPAALDFSNLAHALGFTTIAACRFAPAEVRG